MKKWSFFWLNSIPLSICTGFLTFSKMKFQLCRELDFYEAFFFIINFQKETFTLLIILIVKSLQIELDSTNLLQWNLDLRKPDLRKNFDLRKIVATTYFLVHKLFDLRKIFPKMANLLTGPGTQQQPL